MATKPTVLPTWATAGSITEPSAGKKALGWVNAEAPPHDYFNWWQHKVYEWLLWANDFDVTPTPLTIGSGGAPAYQTGWGSTAGHGVAIDPFKTIRFFGEVNVPGSPAIGSPYHLYTLPSQYRPATLLTIPAASMDVSVGNLGQSLLVEVHTNGDVKIIINHGGGPAAGDRFFFDGLSYRV
ncbi:MAG: hypothetical protein ACKVPX_10000 [Myxococcaceae bacterium]